MSLADRILWLTINNKPIAIFEEHHYALIPWSRWRSAVSNLRLITIDHHCDTQLAFQVASFDQNHRQIDYAQQRAYCAAIDWTNESTINAAIANLRNDEHIDAAIRSGIIDSAFVIAEQNSRSTYSKEYREYSANLATLSPLDAQIQRFRSSPPDWPLTYEMPKERMVAIDPKHYYRGEEYVNPWPDLVLETEHFNSRLAVFEQILADENSHSLVYHPFVLDIDMDAFRTLRSLQPQDTATFYELIRRAVGITLAREQVCCEMNWLDDGVALDTRRNEELMLDYIRNALA